MPSVSIIVPNYNHEKFLPQRLESIFNQTYRDFEVIILDDCSTDNSLEVLKKYTSHPKVSHFIINKQNSASPFKQWKKGIDLAKGKYIWIAESDDWASTLFLEKTVAQIEKDIQIGMVGCDSNTIMENIYGYDYKPYVFNVKTKPIASEGTALRYNGVTFVRENMLGKTVIRNASAVLFRKSLAKGFTDFTKFKQSGDTVFWINLIVQADIILLREKLNYHRRHQSALTIKNIDSNINIFIDAYNVLSFTQKKIFIPSNLLERARKKLFTRMMDKISNPKIKIGLKDAFSLLYAISVQDKYFIVRVLKLFIMKILKLFKCPIYGVKK